jgi:hypothetical protein
LRTLLFIAAASTALFAGATAADATSLHFETTSTSGTFQASLLTDIVPDTSASFSLDISFDDPSNVTISNGIFSDINHNAVDQPVKAFNLAASGIDLAGLEIDTQNNDGASLALTFSTLGKISQGTFVFGGPVGEDIEGSFRGALSVVPLPGSASMQVGALALLALFASGKKTGWTVGGLGRA